MDFPLTIDITAGFMLAVLGFIALLGWGLVSMRYWLTVQAAAILDIHTRLDRLDGVFQALLDDHDSFQDTSDKQLNVLSRMCHAMDARTRRR